MFISLYQSELAPQTDSEESLSSVAKLRKSHDVARTSLDADRRRLECEQAFSVVAVIARAVLVLDVKCTVIDSQTNRQLRVHAYVRIIEPMRLESRHEVEVEILLLEVCFSCSLVIEVVTDVIQSDDTSETDGLVEVVVILGIERA